MSQKKLEALETPKRVAMVEAEEAGTLVPAVSEVQGQSSNDDTKNKLIEAIGSFRELEPSLEDEIREASDIDSLKDVAKVATQALSNVRIALFENTVDVLVADKRQYTDFVDNIEACRDFMEQYIAVKESQLTQPHFMDSAFVNKAIGLAGMVLGAITALLGALAMAVSLGAISTVVLAPAGVIGVNAGAGMVSGGVTAFAFGVGFFDHGRRLSHKATQEPLSANQFHPIPQD